MKVIIPFLACIYNAEAMERVLTRTASGHLIHNSQVFSRDSKHVVFDSRNDETQLAVSSRIGMVDVETGKETLLYETSSGSKFGPGVGAATFSPSGDEVAFIHGLDLCSECKPYGPQRRSAGLVDLGNLGKMRRLDARDVTIPFTPGALRGGTHAFHWSPDGCCLSFTYNDAVIPPPGPTPFDLRTVGVMVLGHESRVVNPKSGEDFSGLAFAMVVVPVKSDPQPGELMRACEEGWVGNDGYIRADGSRQKRALGFIGTTVNADGKPLTEVYIADLPEDLTVAGSRPLEGTERELPSPPRGVNVRRLTHTELSRRPGLQGPRHWIRPSPDGRILAFLDEDDQGIIQLFGISPLGGDPRLLSKLTHSIESPFTWSPDGRFIAATANGRIVLVDISTGEGKFLTEPVNPGQAPCYGVVFSPDGRNIAFNRMLPHPHGGSFLQVCLVSADIP